MTDEKKIVTQRKPTGQEMDRQYDELHEEPNADEFPTPKEEQREKEQELDAYAEFLKDS